MKRFNWHGSWATCRSCRPNPNRLAPWDYDRVLYRRRNEIERLFRRLKAYRRVFSRFDKLDVLFVGLIVFALIFEALRFSVNSP
jgi:transposase